MFPDELKKLNQWVCVKNGSKIPFRAFENKGASSIDPKSWSSYAVAKRALDRGLYDGLGFVFADNGYVAIDIDVGFDSEGNPTDLATDIICHCESYTEKSRSGRGFHIILKGDLPFKGKNNLKGVEIYKTSRYFIMTGDVFYYENIIENQKAIDYVVDKYFQFDRDNKKSLSNSIYQVEWDKPTPKKIKLRPNYSPIENGNRNLCLTSLAGSLHVIGYSRKQILDEIKYANKVACKPLLDLRELESIVYSVTKYRRD